MTDRNPDHAPDGEPVFSARLFPHRSLGPKGFVALMAFIGATSFACGLFFFMIGAWPVVGFVGLDVFAIWLAFRLSYRQARAYEEVAVWPHALRLRQVSAAGRVSEHEFNPSWARLRVERHEEFGITAMALTGQGREVALGAFLNPDDRESFATAFAQALAVARRG